MPIRLLLCYFGFSLTIFTGCLILTAKSISYAAPLCYHSLFNYPICWIVVSNYREWRNRYLGVRTAHVGWISIIGLRRTRLASSEAMANHLASPAMFLASTCTNDWTILPAAATDVKSSGPDNNDQNWRNKKVTATEVFPIADKSSV